MAQNHLIVGIFALAAFVAAGGYFINRRNITVVKRMGNESMPIETSSWRKICVESMDFDTFKHYQSEYTEIMMDLEEVNTREGLRFVLYRLRESPFFDERCRAEYQACWEMLHNNSDRVIEFAKDLSFKLKTL